MNVFQTNKAAEVFIPFELSNNEIQAWDYIQYRLNMYWLQVTYSIVNDDGEESHNTIFLAHLEHLTQLRSMSGLTFYDVYLVSPNHMNGGKGWKMETLKEIYLGQEPGSEYEQEAYIFILDNGNRYVQSYMGSEENDLTQKELIFETVNHSV